MHVREVGNGSVVLLLHGSPSPADDWLPLADALATRYRVLVPDLPGYGKSPDPIDASVERIGDALAAMLLERRTGRLRAVVGYSSGAYRALDLVTRVGVEADLVVTLAGYACLDRQAREAHATLAHRLDANPKLLASAELRDRLLEQVVAPTWLRTSPRDRQRVAGWLATTRAGALSRELAALARSRDLRPQLPQLRSRLYARVGTLDRHCPTAWSHELAQLVPRSTLELVFGCGHALLLEDGPATVAAVRREIDLGRG